MTRFLIRHAALAMALGVFAGLLFPPAAAALHPWIPEMVMALLTTTLLRLDVRLLGAYVRRPGLPLLVIAWLLLGLPLLAWALTRLLPLPPAISLALLLNAATPPLMGAPAMALILGLDAELAAVVTYSITLVFPISLTLLLASGALPMIARPTLGEVLPTVGLLVGGPVCVSFILRRVIPAATLRRIGLHLDVISVSALIVSAVALMHGANLALAADAWTALAPCLASLAFNLAGQGLTIALFHRLGFARMLCLGLMAGNRNLALTLGATAAISGTDFAAYVAFGQLPIYLTPMILARISRYHRRRTT
ncbi:hypothetical protein [Telmatospirillum sp.]|uniref:hypothetical protein n=1 Tax=Telmatospirillum sp. TaxID=2079197 RepID=UPI0028462FA3|nr:hypothetical protein [Telmatospirillum sp.]MDR3438016.1 hypothetical protein [Telmatospirillum sp.]